jgi:hypothetical protein
MQLKFCVVNHILQLYQSNAENCVKPGGLAFWFWQRAYSIQSGLFVRFTE